MFGGLKINGFDVGSLFFLHSIHPRKGIDPFSIAIIVRIH